MLRKLIINNIQSHKHTEIEFDPGYNVIIGTSDHGKSVIFRSIRFVKDNRPSGDSIRSWWGGESSVEIITDEGSVKRIKDKIEEYIVKATGQKEISLKAFKTDVPTEVTQLLRLEDINIQRQLDSHFLLSKTAGEVAAHYNKIAKLDEIDKGTSNVKSKITEISQNIKHKEADKKKKEEELAEFEYLTKFEQEVEVLEKMQASLSSIDTRKRKLQDILKSIDSINDKIQKASYIVKAEKKVNSLLKLFKEKKELFDEDVRMQEVIVAIRMISDEIEQDKILLSAEPIVLAILDLFKKHSTLQTNTSNLKRLIDKISSIKDDLITSQEKASRLEKEYKDNYPEICPFCNSVIKK